MGLCNANTDITFLPATRVKSTFMTAMENWVQLANPQQVLTSDRQPTLKARHSLEDTDERQRNKPDPERSDLNDCSYKTSEC